MAGARELVTAQGARHAFTTGYQLLVRSMGLHFCIPDCVEERVCRGRRLNFAAQNAACGDVMPVEGIHGIVVPAKISPGQSESSKGAFGSRVGKDFGIQLPVGICGSMASNRSGIG